MAQWPSDGLAQGLGLEMLMGLLMITSARQGPFMGSSDKG